MTLPNETPKPRTVALAEDITRTILAEVHFGHNDPRSPNGRDHPSNAEFLNRRSRELARLIIGRIDAVIAEYSEIDKLKLRVAHKALLQQIEDTSDETAMSVSEHYIAAIEKAGGTVSWDGKEMVVTLRAVLGYNV